jgi:hypothetical protein
MGAPRGQRTATDAKSRGAASAQRQIKDLAFPLTGEAALDNQEQVFFKESEGLREAVLPAGVVVLAI